MKLSGEAAGHAALRVTVGGTEFQNPILLAAGTAAYGREISDVIDLDALGGMVTKAVSLEPRHGAPSPRVAEFAGGMLNAIGLANPGVESVRSEHLPWLASHLSRCRVLVNVVGYEVPHFARVVELLDESAGLCAFELNVSCPNVKAGGLEFGADPGALAELVASARSKTAKPIYVKLSPVLPDIAESARIVQGSGADGVTLVNTIPGLLIDTSQRRPMLGFGSGGVSGAALLPVGLLATRKVATAVDLPIIGAGGISTADHVIQYLLAGASLTAIGTAALRDPRVPERVVAGLARWCDRNGVASLADLVGALEWPAR